MTDNEYSDKPTKYKGVSGKDNLEKVKKNEIPSSPSAIKKPFKKTVYCEVQDTSCFSPTKYSGTTGTDYLNEDDFHLSDKEYSNRECEELFNEDDNIIPDKIEIIMDKKMEAPSINIPNLQEKELRTLANDKNLQLISSVEKYKNQYSELDWKCLKCSNIFSASKKTVKRNKYPCPNCREHKGGVQREKIIDYDTVDYSQEVILSEILREAFKIELDKEDISNSELGRLLKYEIKQALNNNTKFPRWIIYRFIKAVNKILTKNNRKFVLKALKEYGDEKGYFLDNNDPCKPESDLAYFLWYFFSNELHDDALTGNSLNMEINSDLNSILRLKGKISISLYLKFESICKEKLSSNNRKYALNALGSFSKIRKYVVSKDAPNYLELSLAKKLWRCFSSQYNNRNLSFQKLSRELYHKDILNENIRINKKFDDNTLDDFESAIKDKLTGNNYNKAIQSLNEYRQKRPPIYVYTEERRQKTSKSMTEKWTNETYLEKMQSRDPITGEDHYRWNPYRDLIIKDILDVDNPAEKTMTQIAEKYGVSITHVRSISTNEVECIYPYYSHEERFPTDFFSLIGNEVHWIIKYILTTFFLEIGLKIYSEIIIDSISKVHVDQFLLNIKDQKYLSEKLKIDEVLRRKLNINKLDIILAFLFDFTSDVSDVNIEAKTRKYQKDNMILFIVGTRWYGRKNQDIKNMGYKNVRIIRHDLFSKLMCLKGKYLSDYEYAIKLSYNADLEGLRDLHNRIKDEFISKYGTELSISRYKTGLFYNDDLKKDLESMGIDYTSFFS